MKSSKVKSIVIVVAFALLFVLVGGLVAAWVTQTTPKDLKPADKPAVETPVEPSDDTMFKAVTGGTYVSFTEEGQGLYINKNIGEAPENKVFAFYGFTKQLPNGVLTKDIFNSSGTSEDGVTVIGAFIVENNKLSFMSLDEDKFTIYDYTTKQFGFKHEDTDVITVKDDGRIVFSAEYLEQCGFNGFYIYPMIEILPEDLDIDMSIEACWTIEEINAVFSLEPFKAE